MSDDWICVYDICASNCYPYPANLSADWSPSRKLLTFSGNWGDIPSVAMDHEPTEDEVNAIVDASDGWHPKMMRAKHERDMERDRRSKHLDRHYQKHGQNHIEITLAWPDGEKKFDQGVGVKTWLDCLQCTAWWLKKLPAGTKIKKFKFTPTKVQFVSP